MSNIVRSNVLSHLIRSGLSFGLWRNPNELDYHYVASKFVKEVNSENLDKLLADKGFVFAPFNVEKHPILFISDDIDHVSDGSDLIDVSLPQIFNINCEITYNEYTSQFDKLIDLISQDKLQKAILSRVISTQFDVVNLPALYEALCDKYVNAYIFCVYTPVSGLWIGATPELLLNKISDQCETVSLAGTRTFINSNNNFKWQSKELDEQFLVTKFVNDVLISHGAVDVNVDGPVEVLAGHLAHLKSTFQFKLPSSNLNLSSLILALHPTPAVSGLPKQEANNFIDYIEKHDRLYYGGFLGEVKGGDCTLYVALRCMQVVGDSAHLFVGGGITRFSEVEKEWEETILKSQTLLSVLKNISHL